ncbi:LPS export ABC transporter permease LptF [Azoarcus sp. TTM-91]|uniref:LPS export ABC transporter permease LptF n=1 Tax=Azoarcus sp. TTM-91 TaxID=2691581 RepID=UPI00145D2CF4|nr:LPS export ABC transporter permease LptF [Azoarcus sp. TTM-91]NMG33613.1 LPS export ABC transporter permease LptF [Azoarcus sp. TTM-91]
MIFRRALQREFAHSAAAVFVALFAILITTVLIRLLGQAAGGRVPSDAVLALIGFGAVTELPIVLTLTVFVAVLLSLSRSYRDSEMVVWFAAGLPLTAWIRPVLRFALPLVLVIGAVTLFLGPWAQSKSAEYQERLDSRDDTQRVAPGVFRESAGARRVFFVEVGAGADGRVRNVFVSDETEERLSVIASDQGFIRTEPDGSRFVVLEKGRRYDGKPGTPEFRVMEFERYVVQIEEKQLAGAPAKTRSKSTAELLRTPDDRNLGELVGRIGTPVAALLLALLAIPLSFVNPRAGRTNNLLIAVFTYLIYSNAITISQAWVSQGRIRFELAVLLPHLCLLLLLAVMFYRRLAVSPFWRARA